MNKLLSIIVPTKDRYKYLQYLVELIASFHNDEIELVIQDNSEDNSSFLSFLEENKYPFVVYNYHKGQLPMSVNSDRAVLNSSGEFLCFIGDDDGVTKQIIDAVHWMKEKGVESIRTSVPSYYWPDASQGRGVSDSAELIYYKYTGKSRKMNSKKELYRVLKRGIPDRGYMPLAYHSIVSREAMNRIYDKCGTFFPGNSPDIANAVALSLCVNNFYYLDIPWIISGYCVFKGGGVGAPGKKYPPEISDMPWFRENAEANWYHKIPRIAVGETIWPESAISALIAMGREDLIERVNFDRMYAIFKFKRKSLWYLMEGIPYNKTGVCINYIYLFVNKYLKGALTRIGWAMGIKKPIRQYDINSISEASDFINRLNCSIES